MITTTYFTATDIYGSTYLLYTYISDVTKKTYYVFEIKNETDPDAETSLDFDNFEEAKNAMIEYIASNPFGTI